MYLLIIDFFFGGSRTEKVRSGFPLYLFAKGKKDAVSIPNPIISYFKTNTNSRIIKKVLVEIYVFIRFYTKKSTTKHPVFSTLFKW